MWKPSTAQAATVLAFVFLWLLVYAFFHPLEGSSSFIVIKLPW
jgi:hypothetical protein